MSSPPTVLTILFPVAVCESSNKLNRKPIEAGFELEIAELKKKAVPGGAKKELTIDQKKAGV